MKSASRAEDVQGGTVKAMAKEREQVIDGDARRWQTGAITAREYHEKVSRIEHERAVADVRRLLAPGQPARCD
jgi:hypothetical protein